MASWFSTTKVNPYGTLNPEQIVLNKGIGPELTKQSTGDAQTNFGYGGQLNAPIGAGEQDVVDNSARMNAVAGGTYNRLGAYDPQTFNTQFDEEIANPTYESYKRNVLPGIQESVPGFSTARANVTARGLQNVSDQLLVARNAARENQKKLALDALSGASNYNTAAAAIAGIPRGIIQAGLTAQYNDFVNANKLKQNSIDQALNFLGISTGTVRQEPTTFGNVLATGQAAANIYGTVMGGGSGTTPGKTTTTYGKTNVLLDQ